VLSSCVSLIRAAAELAAAARSNRKRCAALADVGAALEPVVARLAARAREGGGSLPPGAPGVLRQLEGALMGAKELIAECAAGGAALARGRPHLLAPAAPGAAGQRASIPRGIQEANAHLLATRSCPMHGLPPAD